MLMMNQKNMKKNLSGNQTVNWLSKIRKDINQIVYAIDYYEKELTDARIQTGLRGSVEKHSRDMPGVVEQRFGQLQEIESILEFLNIELRRMRSEKFRKFLEHYNRQLTSRDAEKYVDGDPDVVNQQHLINEFALLRNKYIGLSKALDAKQFQINNIVKLRAAGLEDVSLQCNRRCDQALLYIANTERVAKS